MHLTFAIQRIGQLKDAGDNIYNAVMQDAQTKIVFRQNHDADAVELAPELFRPEFNLNQVKLTAPATVGHYMDVLTSETITESESGAHISTRSESEGEVESEQWSSTTFEGQGDQMHWDGPFAVTLPQEIGHSESAGQADSAGGARSRHRQVGTSESDVAGWGRSIGRTERQVLVPDIRWITTQYKGLEEVIHEFVVALRTLPERAAIVKTMDRDTIRIRTIDVEPAFATPRRLADFVREVFEKSAYTSPLTAIEQEIAERRARLARLVGSSSSARPSDPPGPPPFEAKWT